MWEGYGGKEGQRTLCVVKLGQKDTILTGLDVQMPLPGACIRPMVILLGRQHLCMYIGLTGYSQMIRGWAKS